MIIQKIIENTIGKKSEVIKIESEYSYKNLNRANLKKYITLFSFTDDYGIGALNFFDHKKRWHRLFDKVHLNFFKLVNNYPDKKIYYKN